VNSEETLSSWLVCQDSFVKEYEAVLLESVSRQFSLLETPEVQHNWNYLLRCASVLAQSEHSAKQEISLRISQHCLHDDLAKNEHKSGAQFILNILANRAAIDLAKKRGLLDSYSSMWNDTFIGNLNWVKEEIRHTVWLQNGESIDVNVFQKNFWDSLDKYKTLSVSAPTSAGKSFLIKKWILDVIFSTENHKIAYIVPTRALISEIESDFQSALSDEIQSSKLNITSFPFAQFATEFKPCIYVLTQERLQLLLSRSEVIIDVLIIDEAYKLGDGYRGVLLQYVIDKACHLNPNVKTIYISPQASNPEVLIENKPQGFSSKYDDVTVNQNLIWATQKRGKKWTLELLKDDKRYSLGDIDLPYNPAPQSQKLPMFAYAFGNEGGNIIYVNRASDAEKAAEQLCDLIGFDNPIEDQKLNDLIELCQKVVHEKFKLAESLKYGVAFHYGNIPLIIREEIELLFREGIIKHLVCTSTLVEGVNLPCKNIFIRSPNRGNGNPMNSADFWNLAGRAGRWGKDFQGNIFCIDPTTWDAPTHKDLMPIRRATDVALDNSLELISYINNGTPRNEAASKEKILFESMSSYLAINHAIHGSIRGIPGVEKISEQDLSLLENAVKTRLCIDLPSDLISKHPGISPLAMKSMLEFFQQYTGEKEELLVPPATDTDATTKYIRVFKRLFSRLTNEFSDNPKYLFRQAITTVHWMQGRPVRYIIESSHGTRAPELIHNTIRQVLQDIESIARYKSPKFISCYNDILKHFYIQNGLTKLAEEIEDITLYLEMGVSTTTQLSLLNLGISRTSAVEVKEFITADDLSEKECLEWFLNPNNNWRSRDIPALVRKEIDKMLTVHTRKS
jgi:hypothetical protein